MILYKNLNNPNIQISKYPDKPDKPDNQIIHKKWEIL